MSTASAVITGSGQAHHSEELILDDTEEGGRPWAFLDEARDPSRILEGAIVVTGDEADPVLARVHALTGRASGVKVTLDVLPGDAIDYAEALDRAHLRTA